MKTVFVSGAFNVIHPGHLRLLRFAKECGDKLIVGVLSDKAAGIKAHIPQELRLEGVEINSWVDEAFLIDGSIKDIISKLKPDIVVKGKEHEGRHNIELEDVKKYGGKLLFSSGENVFSSIDLIHREFDPKTDNSINVPSDYLERHNITKNRLTELVNSFSKIKVCVIGDLIIDDYITCQSLGMSEEDPSIVVTPIDKTRFIGGAGIVAAHGAGLGATSHLFTVTGSDGASDYAFERLSEFGVHTEIFKDENRPTTIKERYRSQGKTLLRMNHLYQGSINKKLSDAILNKFKSIIKNTDLIIFSDFNYGCLPQILVEDIISIAKKEKKIIVADSQTSSQLGDISRFHSMDLITPTEKEARVSLKNNEDGLVVLAEKLRSQSNAKNIILKLGEEGILIHASDQKDQKEWVTDRLNALNLSAKDVSGAGDSLLICSALTLASGGSIFESALMGSIAAAVQVSRVGNVPIDFKEIIKVLD